MTGPPCLHPPDTMFVTEESALKAVCISGFALRFVECVTPVICLEAVKQAGLAIELVPEKLRSYDLCVAAVTQNGLALQFISEQTPDLCLRAVQSKGSALQFVKEQTPELCLRAVQTSGNALQFVKEQTPEICLAAVKQEGAALSYVGEKTSEICLAACIRNGYLFHYIPQTHFFTTEFQLALVRAVPYAFRSIKPKTPELCMAAVSASGLAIEHISPEQQTPAICIAAIKQDKNAIKFISAKSLTFEIMQAAIELPVATSTKRKVNKPSLSAAELEMTVATKIADIERACSIASQRAMMVRRAAVTRATEEYKSQVEQVTQKLQKAQQVRSNLTASICNRKQQIEKAREKLSIHEKKAEACATLKIANLRIQQFQAASARTLLAENDAMRKRVQELEARMYH